ncbi:FKBP-type peptidylprolyl isomerase [Flavobacterium album]|uniref:FKBP-type peptidylprolyl isomerase n=1 Tax=Flavobacterium album TaxID=2175091 RepID=A0A2S1R299_9FLAO|nr:FKBP-type peptidylprolyl isomerase [Flavobacterium album]AWH86808.1 FKBP-type peptidylprolyl isomerase [Flavobacterium album]
MNRFLKAFGLLSIITLFAACKKDDGVNVVPPRDYAVQYATEKVDIENYLKTHYMVVNPTTLDATFFAIPEGGTQTSIWEQTEYPLRNKIVNSNNVDYTVYYLMFNEGTGESPTRADNVLVAYSGTIFSGLQFDSQPYPQTLSSLAGTILGWQEIIPLFKTGQYVDTNPNDPPTFQNYGAGAMFLPSGLAYYNSTPASGVSAYDSMIFTFKFYALEYTDIDGDGILNKYETVDGVDIKDYDTDGDDVPNYLDTDDDGDGHFTKYEIMIPDSSPAAYYSFDQIPPCSGGTLKKHLDPSCW